MSEPRQTGACRCVRSADAVVLNLDDDSIV